MLDGSPRNGIRTVKLTKTDCHTTNDSCADERRAARVHIAQSERNVSAAQPTGLD